MKSFILADLKKSSDLQDSILDGSAIKITNTDHTLAEKTDRSVVLGPLVLNFRLFWHLQSIFVGWIFRDF